MPAKKPHDAARICDDGIPLDDPAASIAAATPPFPRSDWLSRQRVRNLGRELRRPAQFAASTAIGNPHTARRFDPPPNLFDELEHVTSLTPPPISPESTSAARLRSHRSEGSQILAWLIVVVGAIAFAAGAGLIAWSLAEKQMMYWNLAIGLTLGGQGTLIFGLVLVVSRLWRSSRYAAGKLQDVHSRLNQLQHTADALTAMRSGGAPAFYADLVRGASPQMLLANLKGQVDQLATRVGNGW